MTTTESCLIYMESYKHSFASVENMQAYADCVNFVYPQIYSMAAERILVGIFILSFIVGAVIFKRKEKAPLHVSMVFGGTGGLMVSFAVLTFITALYFLIKGPL